MGRDRRKKLERQRQTEEQETIRSRAETREDLILFGPLVPARWLVHHTRRDMLREHGKEVPAPISGSLLIDTGATRSSIDDDVALELGADMVGRRGSFGVGGHVQRRVVLATLHIPIPGGGLIYSGEVTSIVGLRRVWASTPPTLNGQAHDVIGLLGRDILQHTVMTYDGRAAIWTLRVVRNGLRHMPNDERDRHI